jgi:hypothetical protein
MGGAEAPADPQVVAGGVLDILEGRTKTTSKISFIDATAGRCRCNGGIKPEYQRFPPRRMACQNFSMEDL